MTQRVRTDPLAEHVASGHGDDAVDGASAQVTFAVLPDKQPRIGTAAAVVAPQHHEQCGRERDETVLGALALNDVDQHATAVDVTRSEPRDFGGT